jgi:carbon-monoxide dehydrogenase medium subunit
MIPGSFSYHRPASIDAAIALLNDLGEDARVIAGGHSLIPMMKLRMATPRHLIDLGAIQPLKTISADGSGAVIGAMVTQADVIASGPLAKALPILAEAAHQIADPQIRSLGTFGGNVANGDPGNDMPALMMCLNASYHVVGKGGARDIAARDFYQGAYFTALEPGDILESVHIPIPPAGHGYAYEKLKRKIGDYATAAAAVILTKSGGKVTHCAIGLTNVAETALFAEAAGQILTGSALEPSTVKKAVAAAEAITAPASDGRGPADYRRKMAGVMLARAIARASQRAA